MGDRFYAQMHGKDDLVRKLKGIPPEARSILKLNAEQLADKLHALVLAKLSGPVLNTRSGRLKAAAFERVSDTPRQIKGFVGIRAKAKYAALLEFGGRTKPRLIRARNANALKFPTRNAAQTLFRKSVWRGWARYPQRSYLYSSMDDLRAEIEQALSDALDPVINSVGD